MLITGDRVFCFVLFYFLRVAMLPVFQRGKRKMKSLQALVNIAFSRSVRILSFCMKEKQLTILS